MRHTALFLRRTLLVLAMLVLTACGGGGADSPNDVFRRLVAAGTGSFVPETGVWWNASEGGSGFTFEVQGNLLLMSSYGYDAAGRAQWYVGALPSWPMAASAAPLPARKDGGPC